MEVSQSVIASDILSTSKLHDGLLAIKPIDIALAVEMDNIMSVFEVQARASGINLSLMWESGLGEDTCIRADPTRINQIIVNLLSNSLRFLEQSEMPRNCFLRVGLQEGRPNYGPVPSPQDVGLMWLSVSIEDTGPGMT